MFHCLAYLYAVYSISAWSRISNSSISSWKIKQIELLSVFSGAQNLVLLLSVPEHIDGHVGGSADHHHMRKLQLLHLLWNTLQDAMQTRQQGNKIQISPGCGIVHHSQPLHSRGHCWQPQPAESIRSILIFRCLHYRKTGITWIKSPCHPLLLQRILSSRKKHPEHFFSFKKFRHRV